MTGSEESTPISTPEISQKNPIVDFLVGNLAELTRLNNELNGMQAPHRDLPELQQDFINTHYTQFALEITQIGDFELDIPALEQVWQVFETTNPPVPVRYRFGGWLSLAYTTRGLSEGWKDLPKSFYELDGHYPEGLGLDRKSVNEFKDRLAELLLLQKKIKHAKDALSDDPVNKPRKDSLGRIAENLANAITPIHGQFQLSLSAQ